ncbi:hypothetical protein AB0A71_06915 [Kitasatospora aureofaciens]|uniref:hypothetical protein n=1 Tax=Kitasatospora aureofaciens TaxID=1894 RepID=UPI0033ECCB60
MSRVVRIVTGFAAAGALMISAAPAASVLSGIGWDVAPAGATTVQARAAGIGWD